MSKRGIDKVYAKNDSSDDYESEIEDTDSLQLEKSSHGGHFKTNRRTCPHCSQLVSVKTYKTHKRLFYNEVKTMIAAITIL